jgi:hypothetical protein
MQFIMHKSQTYLFYWLLIKWVIHDLCVLGGSGGSVYMTARELHGRGSMVANGGSGGGGGGRISIVINDNGHYNYHGTYDASGGKLGGETAASGLNECFFFCYCFFFSFFFFCLQNLNDSRHCCHHTSVMTYSACESYGLCCLTVIID